MVTVRKALLVELFAVLLVGVGGALAASDTAVFGDWDVIGRTAPWLVTGLFVGIYGLVAGLRAEE